MFLEPLRSVTDWLNDPTNGVVAQLATIPLEAGDVAPAVGTIADETRNTQVAQQRLPATPGMAVNVKQIPFMDPNTAQAIRDAHVQLVIRWGTAAQATEHAMRDASYVLRATVKSLRLYLDSVPHVRNSISHYSFLDLAMMPLWQIIDEQLITGAIAVTLICRDIAA